MANQAPAALTLITGGLNAQSPGAGKLAGAPAPAGLPGAAPGTANGQPPALSFTALLVAQAVTADAPAPGELTAGAVPQQPVDPQSPGPLTVSPGDIAGTDKNSAPGQELAENTAPGRGILHAELTPGAAIPGAPANQQGLPGAVVESANPTQSGHAPQATPLATPAQTGRTTGSPAQPGTAAATTGTAAAAQTTPLPGAETATSTISATAQPGAGPANGPEQPAVDTANSPQSPAANAASNSAAAILAVETGAAQPAAAHTSSAEPAAPAVQTAGANPETAPTTTAKATTAKANTALAPQAADPAAPPPGQAAQTIAANTREAVQPDNAAQHHNSDAAISATLIQAGTARTGVPAGAQPGDAKTANPANGSPPSISATLFAKAQANTEANARANAQANAQASPQTNAQPASPPGQTARPLPPTAQTASQPAAQPTGDGIQLNTVDSPDARTITAGQDITGSSTRGPEASSDPAKPQVPVKLIAVAVARNAAQGINRFKIRLDPPELGRVDVRLDVARDGRVRAHMIAERAETLDYLQRDQQALERALNDAGLDTNKRSLSFSLKHNGAGTDPNQGRNDNADGNNAERGHNGDADPQLIEAGLAYSRLYMNDGGVDIRV